jgi:TrmH family RNA methyltransferase
MGRRQTATPFKFSRGTRAVERSQAQTHTGAVRLPAGKRELVKLISGLRQRSGRERSGLYFLEGLRMVSDAIDSRAPVEAVVICPELAGARGFSLAERARGRVQVYEVDRRAYDFFGRHFSLKQGVQGIGALVRQSHLPLASARVSAGSFFVALSAVEDAGNVGAILRTCDAVGCSGVILLDGTADPYGPSSVRASLGAVLTLSMFRAGWAEFRDFLERTGAALIGTSPHATTAYREAEFSRPFVLLAGNEARGLSSDEIRACRQVVSIPMVGFRDSLNVAIATSIVLYEAFGQYQAAEQGILRRH